jgi:hypothetical protein
MTSTTLVRTVMGSHSIHKNFLRSSFGLFSCPLPDSYLDVSIRALFAVSSMFSTTFARSIGLNPGVLQGSPMTFWGFRSDSHYICYTTSHYSIPPSVSSLNHTFRLLLCNGNLTYPPSHCSRHDRSTRSHTSSHVVYPETYVLSFGPSRRATSLFRGQCLLFSPPRVMEFIIFSVIFFIYLALSPISLPCGTFRVSPSSRFTHFCVVRPLCSIWRALFGNVQDSMCLGTYRTCLRFTVVLLVFLFWDLHLFHYQSLFLAYYIYSDLYFLYRTKKNVDTFVFVEIYIISQQLFTPFQKSRLFIKASFLS